MRVFHFLGHIVLGIAAIAGFGAITMLLWNVLVPSIFGLGIISFWQSLGLLILCRLLFGAFGGRSWRKAPHPFYRQKMHNKWLKMTPEEQSEFIKNRGHYHASGHDYWQHGKCHDMKKSGCENSGNSKDSKADLKTEK